MTENNVWRRMPVRAKVMSVIGSIFLLAGFGFMGRYDTDFQAWTQHGPRIISDFHASNILFLIVAFLLIGLAFYETRQNSR